MSTQRDILNGLRCRKGRCGFTLVELLVVIAIIALLTGIILPSMNNFRVAAKKAKTQTAINLIDNACQQYFTDFNDYPPSKDATNYNGWTGSELITLFLTGYGPDPAPKGEPNGALNVDDGVDGFGFRLEKRGYVYGRYGAEKLSVRAGVNNRPEFVDTFGADGNPILYYRWTGSNYDASHNTDGPGDGGQGDMDQYTKNAGGSSYYRTDFILISKGHNRKWNNPCDLGSDDVTNFFNE